ncbi:MAG: GNAT family N-acetyltransferase [Planctomyces sp.]|nr:GNAT family N-acetyltransferase [Planctomyces sp.]MBA4039514.1 GNAT family N-acetyltransferase [Planctomyces sp.]
MTGRDTGCVIVDATRGPALDAARGLFRAYAASLAFSLEYQGFEAELAGLPGLYAPPAGGIWVAQRAEPTEPARAVGCVALRPLAGVRDGRGTVAELKRMYVAPEARGLGLGVALGAAAVRGALRAGYGVIKLDTSADMAAAHAVYRRLGFVPCARYNDDPDPTTRYFERQLGGEG